MDCAIVDIDRLVQAAGHQAHLGVGGACRRGNTRARSIPAAGRGRIGFQRIGADGAVAGIAPADLRLEGECIVVCRRNVDPAFDCVAGSGRQVRNRL